MRLRRKLSVAAALLLAMTAVAMAATKPKTGEEYAKEEQELRAKLLDTELADGPDAESTLKILGDLGTCLGNQQKNAESETVLRTLVARREKTLPEDSIVRAKAYVMLAIPLSYLDKYDEALILYERAQSIFEKAGLANEDLSDTLLGIARVKMSQNKPGEAEGIFRKSLELQTKLYGPDDWSIAERLDRLAGAIGEIARLQKDEVRMKEAEVMLRRALTISEKAFGDSPKTAVRLCHLSDHLTTMDRLPEAEQLMRRALTMDFKLFGDNYGDTIRYLISLSDCLVRLGRYKEAEPFIVRAVDASANFYGVDDIQTGVACHRMGRLLMYLSRIDEAKAAFEQSLAIREKVLGPDHVDVGKSVYNLASVEAIKGNLVTAEQMYRRVLAIDEKAYGKVHLAVADDLEGLSDVLVKESKFKSAEDVQYRLMGVLFEIVGRQHWRSMYAVGNLARILASQSRVEEAEALMVQSTEDIARSLGEEHPAVAVCNETMAFLYAITGRISQAETECRKAVLILVADEKRNGVGGPAVARAMITYTYILQALGQGNEQVRSRLQLIRQGSDPGAPPAVQTRANPRKVS
jgi:tetratricopeptide (TPR) repeat protein